MEAERREPPVNRNGGPEGSRPSAANGHTKSKNALVTKKEPIGDADGFRDVKGGLQLMGCINCRPRLQ